jgi:hypothetical protein
VTSEDLLLIDLSYLLFIKILDKVIYPLGKFKEYKQKLQPLTPICIRGRTMAIAVQDKIVSPPSIEVRINRSFALFVLLITITFLIRVTDINYNSIFIDEAIYVTVGDEALQGDFGQHASRWMYGSYLYPMIAATVNDAGGLEALRMFSAIVSTLAVVFVFLVTLRLFGWVAGFWASFFFSFSASSINLGQFAVYDAPGLLLLAAAFYCVVSASLNQRRGQTHHFFIGGLCFILASLLKYTFALYLPALILTGLILCWLQSQSPVRLLRWFATPVALVLGLYFSCYWSDLSFLLASDGVISPSDSLNIIQSIGQEIGVVLLLAVVGGVLLLRLTYRDWRFESRRFCLLFALLATCLVLSALAGPLYHFLSSNSRSLEKHSVYSLMFLCPIAGYTIEAIIQKKQAFKGQWPTLYSIMGAAGTFMAIVWFVNGTLDRNWGFQNSWPNVEKTVEYARQAGLDENSRVLAEGSQIYEYYFDFGSKNRAVWYNTWGLRYGGQENVTAMVSAIQDHYFDFVILDDYFTPDKTPFLENALTNAGYQLTYLRAPQVLSTGRNISIRVYMLPRSE